MQGSTQLRARHGDRVADEMLGEHEAIVRRAIGGHGGTEVHLARAGRADEVAALRPLLEDALALDDWIAFDGRLVSTRAAIAAAAAQDWDAAERHLATARTTAEALGNRIEQVDLGFWRARMLLARDGPGDREAAAALAADVAARYRELGLPLHVALAE